MAMLIDLCLFAKEQKQKKTKTYRMQRNTEGKDRQAGGEDTERCVRVPKKEERVIETPAIPQLRVSSTLFGLAPSATRQASSQPLSPLVLCSARTQGQGQEQRDLHICSRNSACQRR